MVSCALEKYKVAQLEIINLPTSTFSFRKLKIEKMPINLPKIGEDKKKKVRFNTYKIILEEKKLSARKESAQMRMKNVQKAVRS